MNYVVWHSFPKSIFVLGIIKFEWPRGHQPDPTKLKVIAEWPAPRSLTDLRAFLGLPGFYCHFLENYAVIIGPLTDLLRSATFTWPPSAQAAFESLKAAMAQLSILLLPDFTLPFDVTTYASQIAVGVVLSQQGHPVAFFSKKLSSQLQASSTYVRELYAITETTIQTPEQQKWLSKLLGLHYEIHYKPGKENLVADALSQFPHNSEFSTISAPTTDIFQQLRDFYTSAPAGRELLVVVQAGTAPSCDLSYKAGLLFYKHRVFVPPESKLAFALFQEFYATPFGGHSGIKATLARLSAIFYWPRMAFDVKRYISECVVCQYNKYDPQRPYGLF
ncbi:UNVERIFIED_CONTAM: Retrovirus-related Pol polyprotein from transposon [Sesamum latifolium]|uniref:Retrovirus-related Pol polyprotein from transposon n=1 Tax=Sesamum latifolium TaxID=2727402 RepID=A0AAW2TC32_9LAMI